MFVLDVVFADLSLCISATREFCDMKLTYFCVSTTSGLLHDVFQSVSVHPIPIEMCYGLLSDAYIFL